MASKRGYLTKDELEEYAEITVTDETEADDQISIAEEMIDAYVGAQDSAFKRDIRGRVAAADSTHLTLGIGHTAYALGYYEGLTIEILAGTGKGQRRTISESGAAGVMTVTPAWTTNPDTTSIYRIVQLGKFPRADDKRFYTDAIGGTWINSIPEAVKRATAAQVEYMIENGTFAEQDLVSERIGDYSYERADASVENTIAPKAKLLLKGIKNRKGTFARSADYFGGGW